MKKINGIRALLLTFLLSFVACGGGNSLPQVPQNGIDLNVSGDPETSWLTDCNPAAGVPGQNVQCHILESRFQQIEDCTLFVEMPASGQRIPMEASVLESQSNDSSNFVVLQFQIPTNVTAGLANITIGCGIQSMTILSGYPIVASNNGGSAGRAATGGASGSSSIPVGQGGSGGGVAGVSGTGGTAGSPSPIGGSGGSAGGGGSAGNAVGGRGGAVAGSGGSSGTGGNAGSSEVPVRQGPLGGSGGASISANLIDSIRSGPQSVNMGVVQNIISRIPAPVTPAPTLSLTAEFDATNANRINIRWNIQNVSGTPAAAYIYGFPANGSDPATQCNNLIVDPATGIAPNPMAPNYQTFSPYMNGELCRNVETGAADENCYLYRTNRFAEENYDKCRLNLLSADGQLRTSGSIQVLVRQPAQRFTLFVYDNAADRPRGRQSQVLYVNSYMVISPVALNLDQPQLNFSLDVQRVGPNRPEVMNCGNLQLTPPTSIRSHYDVHCPFVMDRDITFRATGITGQSFEKSYRVHCDNPQFTPLITSEWSALSGQSGSCSTENPQWWNNCHATGNLNLTASLYRTCHIQEKITDGSYTDVLSYSAPWVKDVRIEAVTDGTPATLCPNVMASAVINVIMPDGNRSTTLRFNNPSVSWSATLQRNRSCYSYRAVAHDFNNVAYYGETVSFPFQTAVLSVTPLEATGLYTIDAYDECIDYRARAEARINTSYLSQVYINCHGEGAGARSEETVTEMVMSGLPNVPLFTDPTTGERRRGQLDNQIRDYSWSHAFWSDGYVCEFVGIPYWININDRDNSENVRQVVRWQHDLRSGCESYGH